MFLAKATVGGVTAKGRSPQISLSGSFLQRYRARAARAAAIARRAAVWAKSKLVAKADLALVLAVSAVRLLFKCMAMTCKSSIR